MPKKLTQYPTNLVPELAGITPKPASTAPKENRVLVGIERPGEYSPNYIAQFIKPRNAAPVLAFEYALNLSEELPEPADQVVILRVVPSGNYKLGLAKHGELVKIYLDKLGSPILEKLDIDPWKKEKTIQKLHSYGTMEPYNWLDPKDRREVAKLILHHKRLNSPYHRDPPWRSLPTEEMALKIAEEEGSIPVEVAGLYTESPMTGDTRISITSLKSLLTASELTSLEEHGLLQLSWMKGAATRYARLTDEFERASKETPARHGTGQKGKEDLKATPPEYLYHDTHKQNLAGIAIEGLQPGIDSKVWFRLSPQSLHPASIIVRVRTEDLNEGKLINTLGDTWTYNRTIPPELLTYKTDEGEWQSVEL